MEIYETLWFFRAYVYYFICHGVSISYLYTVVDDEGKTHKFGKEDTYVSGVTEDTRLCSR